MDLHANKVLKIRSLLAMSALDNIIHVHAAPACHTIYEQSQFTTRMKEQTTRTQARLCHVCIQYPTRAIQQHNSLIHTCAYLQFGSCSTCATITHSHAAFIPRCPPPPPSPLQQCSSCHQFHTCTAPATCCDAVDPDARSARTMSMLPSLHSHSECSLPGLQMDAWRQISH